MVTVFCIDCEQPIKLDSRPMEGERILCASCEAELEVISVGPVELDRALLDPIPREAYSGWE